MIIVSNTGPLVHLYEAKCLHLVKLAGEVYVSPMVALELKRILEQEQLPTWLRIESLSSPFQTQASAWHQAGILDAGEAEALSLAQQIKATWFLTDDAAARLLGNTLGLEVHGSLGIVLWAAAARHIDYTEATKHLDGLIESSLWISPKIINDARDALKSIFASAQE